MDEKKHPEPVEDTLLETLVEDWATHQAKTDHPTSETLTSFAMGELAASEIDDLLDHVAVCRECSEILVKLGDVAAFLENPALASSLDDVHTDFEHLGLAPGKDDRQPGQRYRSFIKWTAPLLTLAAGLLIGIMLPNKEKIYVNVPVIDLFAEQDIGRGFGQVKTISSQKFNLLILNPPFDVVLDQNYTMEVVSRQGETLVQETLKPTEDGNFIVGLPGKVLAKTSQIRLLDSNLTVLAEFVLDHPEAQEQ